MEKLFEAFRELGYDGASLVQLSEVTGLKKASLYHRFPEGKGQMVQAVLDYADQWVQANVIEALVAEGDPPARLSKALKGLEQLYAGGQKTCILRALSVSSDNNLFRERLDRSFAAQIRGFRQLALDFGWEPEEAQWVAERAVIQIQGALVLARARQDVSFFTRTLQDIASSLPPGGKGRGLLG